MFSLPMGIAPLTNRSFLAKRYSPFGFNFSGFGLPPFRYSSLSKEKKVIIGATVIASVGFGTSYTDSNSFYLSDMDLYKLSNFLQG